MKLLYVYDKMPQTYQKYLVLLLDELRKQIDVKVLAYDNDKKADFKLPKNRLNSAFNKLLSVFKKSPVQTSDIKIMSNFDIVHLQLSYLYSRYFPFFNNRATNPKIVITLRGADTYIKPWIYKKWEFFYKTQSQYIAAFVTVSQNQKDYLQRWGVPENKIHVIPASLGDKTLASPKYPSEETIKIISAFRMCWEKNIDGNLRTVKLLKENGYAVQYDMYGDGPDKGQVYYLVDKYNLGKQVNYHGKVENEALKNKLSNYDFYLQLSHSESYGVSVVEAQSMGVPAIVSNADGLPDSILENKSGFCVDSHNSDKAAMHIIDLFKDKEKYHSFSKAAITNSNEKFTTKKEVERLMKLYKSL